MNDSIKQFIKSDKFILIIFGVIGVILVTILALVIVRKHQTVDQLTPQPAGTSPVSSNSNASPQGSKQSNQPFNLFTWLFPSNNNTTHSEQAQVPQQAPTNTTSGLNQTNVQPTQSGQSSNETSSNISSGTNNNSNSGTTSDPNATQFQIVFNGPGGQTETYVPPAVPPIQVTWATYTDTTYHYSIQYPSDWQVVNKQTIFAKGTILFLPGENTNDPSEKYIAFGWSNYNIYPTNSINNGGSVATPAMVTGVNGTIFTRGPLGISYIVSVFPYREGYFGLITYTSDPTITYIYQYMLASLKFNQ
jgi:hypothetical protein